MALRTRCDGGPKGLGVERLLEPAIADPRKKRRSAGSECAARHEHEAAFETWEPLRDLGEEIHPRHVRHHQIAENHVVRRRRPNESVETLMAVDGDIDVTFIFEHSNDHRGQCWLVVDHEDTNANLWSFGIVSFTRVDGFAAVLAFAIAGRITRNVEPAPSVLSTVIVPPCAVTMP